MTFATVCSGIGAPELAWTRLGWQPVFSSEIEAFPSAVLAHHYPQTPNLGDMTKFKEWKNVGTVDVLCGGTPCQSFSIAGLRGGLADPRGNLMLIFGALANHFRPRWICWENVPGVLSSNGGRDFGTFLGMLGQLGYGFAYRVLDAQYFGLAQRRKRVFVVGYFGDWRRAAAVLFESESLCWYPPPSRRKGEGFTHDAAQSFGASGRGYERAGETRGQDPVISLCLNASSSRRFDPSGETFVTHSLRGEGHDASEDGTGRGIPLVTHPLSNTHGVTEDGGGRGVPIIAGTVGADSSSGRSYGSNPIPDNLIPIGIGGQGLSGSLRSSPGSGFRSDGSNVEALVVQNKMSVRRLTPRECERLQGFPDDYTRIKKKLMKRKPHSKHFVKYPELYQKNEDGTWLRFHADSPRYKALGNSMAVPVLSWIGKRIEKVEKHDTV